MLSLKMTAMGSLNILGLVGGIGSGKSYIASLFGKKGALVVNADVFAHEALRQPEIKDKLRTLWGEAIFAGDEVDRPKVADLVFNDAEKRQQLEAIVLPYIHGRIQHTVAKAESDPNVPLVVLDAAILLETGYKPRITALAFVDTPELVRIERVKARGWDADELRRREAHQWSLEKKRQLSDVVIPNQGDEVLTERLVNELFTRYAR
jgi:dephospho-CoA kinase